MLGVSFEGNIMSKLFKEKKFVIKMIRLYEWYVIGMFLIFMENVFVKNLSIN